MVKQALQTVWNLRGGETAIEDKPLREAILQSSFSTPDETTMFF